MARRKRQFLEDDDDSDSSPASETGDFDEADADLREEHELFADPYQRGKKRRKNHGKDAALYGDDSDDQEDPKPRKRNDWTKAPSFVTQEKKAEPMDVDQDDTGKDEEEEEESEQAGLGAGLGAGRTTGLGAGRGLGVGAGLGARQGLGAARATSAFSGFTRGAGIGSSITEPTPESKSATPEPTPFIPDSLPSAFGASRPSQRSFVRNESESAGSTRPATPLSAQERAHFSKLQGSFGARMLEKMGWSMGAGLGSSGEGRINPVETKLRKRGMGLAFGGFTERTEQEKLEARRRGEVLSEDEDDQPGKKGRSRTGDKQKSDAWKRPKKVKVKVEHKSYEEILAEAGEVAIPPPGIGQIIDAPGATLREVSSLADVSIASWTPTSESTHIPEVRHNLRLITESSKSDLDGLAREARALEERKKWIREEDLRLRKKVGDEAELIARLQQVHLVVDEINVQSRQLASSYEASLEPFSASFDNLLGQFPMEFERYRLDEIVVAAIAPIIRRMLVTWKPLEDPNFLIPTFQLWRHALKITATEAKPETGVQVYGSGTSVVLPLNSTPMSPFESWLWHAWLPKVRSAINNDWSPDDPSPAIRLYEVWSRFLPPFIRDNFFDQLVLPKVHKAVADWNPKKQQGPLHTLIFPWLPHVGLRVDEVLGEAARKVKSLLRAWKPADDVPKDILVWKDVFDSSEWEALLLKYVVPKLGATLREDFQVNPANQDMKPIQQVLAWSSVLRSTIFSQLLETQFFPKWLNTLHQWLIHPGARFDEIAEWYKFWKDVFPEHVQRMSGVERGFTSALQLLNKAIELGPEVTTRLPPPDLSLQTTATSASKPAAPAKNRPSRTQEITFRSIVEDFASSHNLLFIPAGKVEEKSRMPLFRVSQTADGKGGLLVYILDDAVWASDGDAFRAIGLEDMVLRANKR